MERLRYVETEEKWDRDNAKGRGRNTEIKLERRVI